MPSDHVSQGIVEKLSALIGRRSLAQSGGTHGGDETGRAFDAIMLRLDSGIAAYRKDMSQLLESLSRPAA